MNENDNITTEVTEEDFAGFDDGWDDETVSTDVDEPAEENEETEANTGADNAGVNQTDSNAAEDAEPETAGEAAPEGEDKAVNQSFTLRHLGEERTVSSEEVVALAQKGLDYDRQKADYEAFQNAVNELGGIDTFSDFKAFIEELAASSNVGVQEIIDITRASMLAKKEGILRYRRGRGGPGTQRGGGRMVRLHGLRRAVHDKLQGRGILRRQGRVSQAFFR